MSGKSVIQPNVNCPACESEQPFVPHIRNVEQGWQEEFIVCRMCNYQSVIRYTTPSIEALRKLLRKYERSRVDIIRSGRDVSSGMVLGESQTRRTILILMEDLEKEMSSG